MGTEKVEKIRHFTQIRQNFGKNKNSKLEIGRFLLKGGGFISNTPVQSPYGVRELVCLQKQKRQVRVLEGAFFY